MPQHFPAHTYASLREHTQSEIIPLYSFFATGGRQDHLPYGREGWGGGRVGFSLAHLFHDFCMLGGLTTVTGLVRFSCDMISKISVSDGCKRGLNWFYSEE